MSTQQIANLVLHEPPLLRVDDAIEPAVRVLLESDLPALPVVDADGLYAGIFGEREFMGALFPAYLQQLKGAGFLRRPLDEVLERRESCRDEVVAVYMNTEHVEVGTDFADAQVAEIFLHHRVLVVPVVTDGRVVGMITRHGFFRAVAERFVGRP